MREPRICIAGLDVERAIHIRPVPKGAFELNRSQITIEGGTFGVGARVDFGELTADPSPPEVEDQFFEPDQVRFLDFMKPNDYLSLIDEAGLDSLDQVFGPALERDGHTYSVPEGRGEASLGCVRVQNSCRPEVLVNDYGRVKFRMETTDGRCTIAVTDIRFFEPDQETPRLEVIESVKQRLRRGVPLRLMVGLTQAWSPDASVSRHWLQINGFCLEDSPLGELP
jgi:hypothetical protein